MNYEETMNNSGGTPSGANPRREFLTRLTVAGLGGVALALSASAQAATEPHQPAADTGHDYTMPLPDPTTAKQFYAGVIPIAVLSRAASGLAVDKASAAATQEFANFELREAIGVYTVLTQMGTPVPPLDAHAKATLAKLKSSQGVEFDKVYITAELGAHEFLRDMTETYLKNSAGHTGMEETHARHIGMLALATFKEHIVHCKNIKASF